MTSDGLPAGKLPAELLARLLAADASPSSDVLLGPAIGEDACALALPGGAALVAATDPITFTSNELGRYAVVVNANDVAVTGVRPKWFLATVLLPTGTAQSTVETIFTDLRASLSEVGASLVGGHTEVTGAVNQPVIVGQMLGVATDGRFVPTGGALVDDVVVQVGAVPVEGAAVLAAERADRLRGLPAALLAAARNATREPGLSVVDVALAAARLGATAMHDPTEGGLASGLHELAVANRLGVRVQRDQIAWFEPGVAICDALGADPWAALASGSLLATFPRVAVDGAVAALAAYGRPVAVIGVLEPGDGVRDAEGCAIGWPERDEVARLLES